MKIYLLLSLFLFHTVIGAVEPLHVGMELTYPPFEMVCPNGTPCGISVDIANALGKALDRKVVIENNSYIGLIPALKNGQIDLIISSMTETQERTISIDFSQPYAVTGLCLLISAKSNLKDIEGANFPNRTIVVKSGTTGELYAAQHLTEANVRVLDKESMCVLEVVQGKADAFIYDQLSVYKNWQKNLQTTRALLTPFQKEFWAIGLKKGNDILLAEVNRFITNYREAGGFEKLADKYLPQEKAAFQRMGIPFIFAVQ